MEKVFFLTGANPPQTGGELYNYQLSEYLEKLGWEQEYVSLHEQRHFLRLGKIPIIGDILVSLILAVILFKYRGILIEDHYFSRYLLLTNIIQRFFRKGKIVILIHLFYTYKSEDKFVIRRLISKYIEKIRLSFADLIVTSSEYSKSEIVSVGINPELVHVLSPGLDRDKFKSPIPTDRNSEIIQSKKILCVGNYVPRKGILYLIEAFYQIERQNFTLHLVGNRKNNSSYYHKLNNAVKKLKLTEYVVFHDGADRENIKQLYASADIFVLPSFQETFGIVFLEAMHYGLPIITTNVTAMPELIEEGKNGFLVPPADSQALAKAISKLIENPDLIKQMGEAGRKKIANSYYWEQTCSGFASILEKIKMQNILSIDTSAIKEDSAPDILVVSRTFLPKEGGIEEYVYNRCLQNPERVIMLAAAFAGYEEFDRDRNFIVHRWHLPKIPRLFGLGAIIKQLLNMFWSFVLAIKLYFRYRYRYIEWGHGYDFPSILLLSYFLPINFFIYIHGDEMLCALRNPVFKKLFELTLQRATGIVCNSSFTRDYLGEKFNFNTPTYVINPIVRTDKFGDNPKNPEYLENQRLNIRKKYNISENAIVILGVGRLVKRKGFGRIIDNLNQLLEQGLDVHYIICGRGKMQSELEQKAEQLQVKERVHFAGFVSDADLAAYYAASDIFAMPTFFDSKKGSIEGFGIVYAEAGYFGKPVIASRIGGVEDAVHHEENGLLVNPDFPEEISQALTRLCKDKELREKLGSKGKEMAQRKTPHSILYS